jgi:putative addiction module component (TIGR02574 family)
MPASPLDVVEAAALRLSAEERAELIDRSADTVLPPSPLHPAWETEIAKRVAELDAGFVEGIPADKVFADLQAMIEAHDRKS